MINDRNTLILLISSVFVTLFLAFIDEGNYNFVWVYDLGSWVAFLIYTMMIFFMQFLVFKVILRNYQKTGLIFSGILIGTIIGLMVTLGMM